MVLSLVIDDLFEINRRLSFNLWNLTDVNSIPTGLSPRLIFPKMRSGEKRISEQESLISYCGILNTLNYYYSIETPTKEVYQQTGKNPKSARSDISLYNYDGNIFVKVANVELKAKTPGEEQIRKDIEKLLKEGETGNWFHTLFILDSTTLRKLFDKFRNSFKNCSNYIHADKGVSILFCFCVLEQKWVCIKHFHYDSSNENLDTYIDNFFRIEYNVKSRKIDVNDENDWEIISNQ